ncbi:MAG: hypothetical protein IPL20_06355 [Saprospiraceae bacterium]|nr:hypothetical protein [Saprospiraceae bacterium]
MKHWLFIAILLLMTLSSCFQEKEIFIPRNTPEDPAYLYTQLENRPTHFILNISEEDVYFTTPQKNVIRIQKGSLLWKVKIYCSFNLPVQEKNFFLILLYRWNGIPT